MTKEAMKLIQVVRHYGPVGGMERYVWEQTKELADKGHQIIVLCEQCHAAASEGIEIHELGQIARRPRWLAYIRFSRRVARWLRDNPQPGCLIHSNERIGVHDITTFHGPPFASVRDKPWWKKISIRVAAQLWLERRELRVAKAIVPNSEIIAKQLAHYYPEYAHKLTPPIVPGVLPGVMRTPHAAAADGGIIGFVGREWQRKGLPLAGEIVAHLRRTRPNLELWVVGPKEKEIDHLFKGWQGGYRLLGWRTDNAHFEKIDVLLHPAKAEPYGMVISEAMAAHVPVVVSDLCGAAAQVTDEHGAVVRLDAPVQEWVTAVDAQLARAELVPGFIRGWDVVAEEFVGVYAQVQSRS
jgi:UDP-glucose:(heptosyl)LPS alpha-1,3-glucosyltransferase